MEPITPSPPETPRISETKIQKWKEQLRIALRAPRQLRPTRAGWMFLLINLAIGFAALNTGNNLLYLVLSLLLAFLTLSGLLSESALRGIEIQRTIPREIYAGSDDPVRLEVHNSQGKIPAFAIVVEDRCCLRPPGDPEPKADWRLDSERDLLVVGRVFALRVGPGQIETRSYSLHRAQRGELRFHSARVSTRFPFGLFCKSRILFAPGRALVFPEITPLETAATGHTDESPSERSTRSRNGPGDISRLREWQTGDSLHRVHWKTSLRRNRLFVRSQQDDAQDEIEVRLHTGGRSALGNNRFDRFDLPNLFDREFEKRVSWAASEIVFHLAAGSKVGLVTDSTQLRAAFGDTQRLALLSFLARVRTEAAGTPSTRLATPACRKEQTQQR